MPGRSSKGCRTRVRCSTSQLVHFSEAKQFWGKEMMKNVVVCCIILQNMMVEHREAAEGQSSSTQPRSNAVIDGTCAPHYHD
eukprot:IDg3443t1